MVSRGSNGQTLKKLQIRGKAPGKVLSEGEQRAISIANFLTEVKMDIRNGGVVLDDPVCSLDHKRRSLIVKRLVEEAKIRQVVVFTHEITFFMELKTEADKNQVIFEQETIRKICDEPGDISTLIPWQGMNVKDRTGKLKNDLQAICSVYNSGDMDTYYYKAKEWCELLRESWERAVEEILFNDAIQRYNPCVQTQRLKKAPVTRDLYTELEQGMTECSAWCHDQARDINAETPSYDDLKHYIDCFEAYCKQNKVK
ncbi:AAA family ATPase [Roseburia hominis]|uniref:AAA family ATPase n=1 Tax=Roseburia hominis TaxID=301301 RepID=UPI00241D37C4